MSSTEKKEIVYTLETNQLSEIEELKKSATDWETRNKLRVYEALQRAKFERNFRDAALLLIEGLSTFNCPEVIAFDHYVKLTIILSLMALERPILKTRVANSPQVLQILAEQHELKLFFDAFLQGNYKVFFENFHGVSEEVKKDKFIGEHYRYFVRQMRLAAYRQYLRPYRSVTLPAMAQAFGVSEHYIEQELVSFISTGHLSCTIDKVEGTIITIVEDVRAEEYKAAMQASTDLTNQLMMVSRVMN